MIHDVEKGKRGMFSHTHLSGVKSTSYSNQKRDLVFKRKI